MVIKIVLCPRCYQPCQISDEPSKPDAQPLKRTKDIQKGLCPNCALTGFIKSVETMGYGIAKNGVEMFRNPLVQKGFADLFKAGNSDANISEINWNVVIENWDLPFPKVSRKKL